MENKYSRLWFKVHQITSKAQKDIYAVVEDICRLVYADLSKFLDELRRVREFTYVIEPLQGNGDIMRCVPCVYLEADRATFEMVKLEVVEKFPEVVSESRLIFELRPRQPAIEGA